MATKKLTTTSQPSLDLFNLEVSPSLLAQAIYVYQENSHVGTSKVKTRGEINLTKKKVYKQKGTGNARHGSKSAPIYVGGGVVFGPRGMKLATKSLNKKMKNKALAGSLTLYRKEERLALVDPSSIKELSAKSAAKVIGSAKVGLVYFNDSPTLLKTVANLDNVTLLSANRLNIYKVVTNPKIILTPNALAHLEQRLSTVLSSQAK